MEVASGGLAGKLVGWVGRTAAWLILAMVLLTFAIVVLRYGFNLGWIALQESVSWLHATVFMLAIAWTFQTDDHVRVDIFYRDRSPRHRAWVNIFGIVLFLIPLCLFMGWQSWDYVQASWMSGEASREAGGLPAIYLLKSLLLLMPALLLLQAASSLRINWRQVRSAAP